MDMQRAIRMIRYYGEKENYGGLDMVATMGWSGGGGTIMGTLQTAYGDISPADLSLTEYVPDEIDAVSSDMDVANVRKMRSLLSVLSSGVPFAVDISKMSQASELNRNTILLYIAHLYRARLVNLLYSDTQNIKRMQKPDKIYMENTNLLHALSLTQVEAGTVRETYFYNQTCHNHELNAPKQGDFLVDGKYTFEVGGADKRFERIKDLPDSYLAIDGVEFGRGNKIPLWLFGFLY